MSATALTAPLSPDEALKYVQGQMGRIRTEVDGRDIPIITYRDLIPLAPPQDPNGKWDKEIYMAREGKRQVQVYGVGFDFDVKELTELREHGLELPTDKAHSARYVSEEHLQRIAFEGDALHGWKGLINQNPMWSDDDGICTDPAPAQEKWNSAVRLWKNKTGEQVAKDINFALFMPSRISGRAMTLANTLLVPAEAYTYLSVTPIKNLSDTSILTFVTKNNAYSEVSGQPLTIRVVRGLENAASSPVSGGGRMVAYRRDPEVLRFHLPVPHHFVNPEVLSSVVEEPAGDDEQRDAGEGRDGDFFLIQVPGFFHTAGLEIRNPDGVHYVDGIV